MTRLFGTDGVRGVANTQLTPELAFRMGQAAAEFLGDSLVIGKDTRKSGDMLEAAFIAGATSWGADVYRAGVIPTPAVALLTRQIGARGGVVVSASHNPAKYNGIKFFDGKGMKLTLAREDEVEEFLHQVPEPADVVASRPIEGNVGRVREMDDAVERYVSHAVADMQEAGIDLEGLKVVVDCGHGAASNTTPEALRRLGADLTVINDSWNGLDINRESGSTHMNTLRRVVAATRADVGLAHDGDADRLLAIDENGETVDGDMIEAICAVDLDRRGKLSGRRVVSTVMCNLGFQIAMRERGITVDQTPVGDRHVLERMIETGAVLGGEQSGHIIFLEHNSTGDGLITALALLACMRRTGESLSSLEKVMTRYPQVLVNVRTERKEEFSTNSDVAAAVRASEEALGEQGRVLVRASGTEPLVRVMVEAASEYEAAVEANAIAKVVVDALDGEAL